MPLPNTLKIYRQLEENSSLTSYLIDCLNKRFCSNKKIRKKKNLTLEQMKGFEEKYNIFVPVFIIENIMQEVGLDRYTKAYVRINMGGLDIKNYDRFSNSCFNT